jgi:lactoylglutathione lyase
MKYLWTTINVKDMDASIAYYSDLVGLKALNRFPAGPGKEITFMGNGIDGETTVELIADANLKSIAFSEFINLGFAVSSMDDMLTAVKNRNIPIHSGPFETPAFQFFTIKDPDGLNIQFFEKK